MIESFRRRRKVIIRTLLLFVASAELMIGFSNCSGFSPSQIATTTGSIASLCLASAAAREAISTYNVKDICGDASHYVCETRAGDASASEQCADIQGEGRVCMTVDVVAASSAFTAHCANIDVQADGNFLIQADGDTWDQALASAINKCRMRSL